MGNSNNVLMINGLTGCVDLVDSDVAIVLQKTNKENCVENLENSALSILVSRGHLVPENADDELNKAREFFKNYERYTTTLHIIVLTYRCNFGCAYCYQKYIRKEDRRAFEKDLTPEYVTKIYDAISQVDEQISPRMKRPIHLYGGEPLLLENKDLVGKVLSMGTSLNYRFVIVTNGFYLQKFVHLLCKYKIVSVQVTLDGKQKIHDARRPALDGQGSFNAIVDGVKAAINDKIRTNIRINFDGENLKEIPDLIDYLSEERILGNPLVGVYLSPTRRLPSICSPLFPVDISPIEFARLADERMIELFEQGSPLNGSFFSTQAWIPHFYHCRAHSQLFYDPYGDVYVCLESLKRPDLKVGTYVPALSFSEKYKMWKNRNVFNLDSCMKCQNALICGGGCTLHAYLSTGSIMNSDCISFRPILGQYASYLAERIRLKSAHC
jgi:uncharacterized protein